MIEYGYDVWPKKKLNGELSWNEYTGRANDFLWALCEDIIKL